MNIKLHAAVALYYELNGIAKSQDEIVLQGILKQKMPLKVKIYLDRLNKIVTDEVKLFEDARKVLFDKYGEQADGATVVKTENQDAFRQELQDILNTEVNIHKEIWASDLSVQDLAPIETDEYYPVFFQLFDK